VSSLEVKKKAATSTHPMKQGGKMIQPEKKTIEEIAAMSGPERSRYLLSLPNEERQAIDEEELLHAIDAMTVQMLTNNLDAETDNS
jgi:hypothetical protein